MRCCQEERCEAMRCDRLHVGLGAVGQQKLGEGHGVLNDTKTPWETLMGAKDAKTVHIQTETVDTKPE